MSIKYLPRTPRLPTTIEDGAGFVKALYNTLLEIGAAVNAILDVIQGAEWTAPTLLNYWVNYGNGCAPAGYFLDASGFVHLRGAVKNGTGVIFVLPAGYRPEYLTITVGMSASYTPHRVDIATDGNVSYIGGGSVTFISLEGITFKAAA